MFEILFVSYFYNFYDTKVRRKVLWGNEETAEMDKLEVKRVENAIAIEIENIKKSLL